MFWGLFKTPGCCFTFKSVNPASGKDLQARGARQVSGRRSFHLRRSGSYGDTCLIDVAAKVAWRHLKSYSAADIDGLPGDLLQRLVDKCIQAGKLDLDTLQKFASQPLYHLDLSSVQDVSNSWLAVTRGFALQDLSLGLCDAVDDEGLEELSHHTALTSLDLSELTLVTDEGLCHLSGLTGLHKLSLKGLDAISQAGLQQLAGHTKLTSLSLELCEGVDDLRALAGMRRLRQLNLGWCACIGDSEVAVLQGHAALAQLMLSGTQVGTAGLRSLVGMQQLTSLSLACCQQLDDAALAVLATLSSLQALCLERCKGKRLTSSGFEALGALTALEELNVAFTAASQGSMLSWTRLTRLRVLNMDSCEVNANGLELVRHTPRLEELDLSDTTVGNAGVSLLPRYTRRLRSLHLSYSAVSDSCTPSLARLSRLERLCLDTRAVGDAGLRDLAPLTSLRHLDLFGAKITDKGCAFLSNLKRLEYLEVCGGSVTDAGVAHIAAPLGRLTHLSLAQNARITDVSTPVLSQLCELVYLNLTRSRLSSTGVQRLHPLTKLEVLIVEQTRVRRPALDRLHLALPGLQVLTC